MIPFTVVTTIRALTISVMAAFIIEVGALFKKIMVVVRAVSFVELFAVVVVITIVYYCISAMKTCL